MTLQLGFAGGLHTAQKDRGCHLHPSPTVNLGSQAEGCSSPDSLHSACSPPAWEPVDAGAGREGPYVNYLQLALFIAASPSDVGERRGRVCCR